MIHDADDQFLQKKIAVTTVYPTCDDNDDDDNCDAFVAADKSLPNRTRSMSMTMAVTVHLTCLCAGEVAI